MQGYTSSGVMIQDKNKKLVCEEDKTTEADKGQSQNICEIRKNVFKIRKNISNRNVFWKSSLKSLSNLKNYYKSQKNY